MAARERTREISRVGGETWNKSDPAGTRTVQNYIYREQTTKDVVGKLKRPDGSLTPSFFESNTTLRLPGTFSRLNPPGTMSWCMKGRCFQEDLNVSTSGYPTAGSNARNNANALIAARVVANTHPFAPYFSVPVAIKEMVELGTLFKLAAKSFAEFTGNAYLNYRFGYVQFVRDVRDLAGIMKHLEKRIRDFNFILEHGYTRKRVKIGVTGGGSNSPDSVLHSTYSVIIRGDFQQEWTMETWATIVWGVNGKKLLPTDQLALFNEAVRYALDVKDIDAATLWQLIPFSWLVDYFLNVGDILQSQHLRYDVQPYDICIMRHYIRTVRLTPTDYGSTVTINSPGFYQKEIKTRDVVNPPLTSSLSFDLIQSDRWKVILALLAKFSRAGAL